MFAEYAPLIAASAEAAAAFDAAQRAASAELVAQQNSPGYKLREIALGVADLPMQAGTALFTGISLSDITTGQAVTWNGWGNGGFGLAEVSPGERAFAAGLAFIPVGRGGSMADDFARAGMRSGAKGGRGPAIGWSGFDVNSAGGPLRNLRIDRARVTHGGVGLVERHLARFGPDAANDIMVNRLRSIASGNLVATPTDLRFYLHEIREGVRYRNMGWSHGVPANLDDAMNLWRQTHSATLYEYGLPLRSEELLYVPEALRAMGF
jgi:hypothetical protein